MVYWIQFPGELSSPAWLPFFVWGNQHSSLNVKWKSRQSNISMLMLILGLKRSARIFFFFFRYGFVTFHNEESVRQVTDMVIWLKVFSYFQIIVPHSSTHVSPFQFVLNLLTSFPYYLKEFSLTKIYFSSYRNQISKVLKLLALLLTKSLFLEVRNYYSIYWEVFVIEVIEVEIKEFILSQLSKVPQKNKYLLIGIAYWHTIIFSNRRVYLSTKCYTKNCPFLSREPYF